MAAEVSSLVRVLTGYNKDDRHRTVGNESAAEKLTPLITRDLLSGGYSKFTESQELDLDLHVPSGWERRLDLKVPIFLNFINQNPNWNSPPPPPFFFPIILAGNETEY